jgi:hypothetical protein
VTTKKGSAALEKAPFLFLLIAFMYAELKLDLITHNSNNDANPAHRKSLNPNSFYGVS